MRSALWIRDIGGNTLGSACATLLPSERQVPTWLHPISWATCKSREERHAVILAITKMHVIRDRGLVRCGF
jgi:hypothetical protein